MLILVGRKNEMVLIKIVSSHGVVGCWNIIKELYLYNNPSLMVFYNFLHDQHVLYLIMDIYKMVKKFIETTIDPN